MLSAVWPDFNASYLPNVKAYHDRYIVNYRKKPQSPQKASSSESKKSVPLPGASKDDENDTDEDAHSDESESESESDEEAPASGGTKGQSAEPDRNESRDRGVLFLDLIS